jgi:putative membrane protein
MEETAGTITGIIVGLIISTLLNSIIIWIVAKLGLGIELKNFGTAILAAFLSALIGIGLSKISTQLFGASGGTIGGIILHILGSALVLLLVSKLLSGMKTKGFLGAILAAISIGVLYYLISLILK